MLSYVRFISILQKYGSGKKATKEFNIEEWLNAPKTIIQMPRIKRHLASFKVTFSFYQMLPQQEQQF